MKIQMQWREHGAAVERMATVERGAAVLKRAAP